MLIKDFSYFPDIGFYSESIVRSKPSPAYTSGKLKIMYDQIKVCSDKLMKNIDNDLEGKSDEIEVRDLMGKHSNDVFGTRACGLKLSSKSDDESPFRKYLVSIFTPSLRMIFRELCLLITPKLLKVVILQDFQTVEIAFFHTVIIKEPLKHRLENIVVRNDFVNCLKQARNDLTLNTNQPKHDKDSVRQEIQISLSKSDGHIDN
ncbi:hypothetical protein QTP88_021672 [Uroleucon formosanum]